MSLFQFHAVATGWARANGADKPQAPSDAEFDEMVARSAAARAVALK